jgi:hypothetical protein
MGLTGYYRKFLKNYGKIVAPLPALLKNNSFTWTTTASEAFQTLNMTMCTTPVLAIPDFKKTFVLECDASGKGIGVVQCTKRKCWIFFMQLICGGLIY